MKLLPTPRRIRRPLLLPVGWVALGWLLLLGCELLQAHWRQLRQGNVLQISMLPLKQDTTGFASYQHYNRGSDTPYDMPYLPPFKLNRLRPWHDAVLRGGPIADFLNAAVIEAAIRVIQADSARAGGVRVRLLPGATYANLVTVLDVMSFTNQKVYWLDIQHRPITLYALTKKELPSDPSNVSLTCGCCSSLPSPAINSWQQWLDALQQPAWRIPLLLLAVLGCLSAYRLALGAKSG